MVTVTGEQVISTLREVAAERPDYVYTNPDGTSDCKYVHTDDEGNAVPGCIVGCVLNRLGVELSTLITYEGRGARTMLDNMKHSGALNITGPLAETAGHALSLAQDAQDGMFPDPRKSWGDAVAYADRVAASVMV